MDVLSHITPNQRPHYQNSFLETLIFVFDSMREPNFFFLNNDMFWKALDQTTPDQMIPAHTA